MSVEIKKLDNGITLISEKIEYIKSVSVGFFVKTGSKNEKNIEKGVSHFIEHMLFKGTKTRSSKEISETIDATGGYINAYTTKENTAYYIQLLSSKLDVGLNILIDMFLNSTFSKENMKKEKNVIIEEINMYEDIPEDIIHDINARNAIKGALGCNILGSKKSVENISREILIDYFNENYSSNNIIISIAGNFDINHVFNTLNKNIGQKECRKAPKKEEIKFSINKFDKLVKRNINQVHLCVNSKGISLNDSNRYTIGILSNILAGNMSSRLFQKIREERGLAYSVYSYLSSYKEGGLFTVYAGTTVNDYKLVIDLIIEEFKSIENKGVFEKELEKSKNQFLSSLILSLENSKARMSRNANSLIIYNEVKSVDDIVKEIESVSLGKIKSVAEEIFKEEYFSKTIVGDIN